VKSARQHELGSQQSGVSRRSKKQEIRKAVKEKQTERENISIKDLAKFKALRESRMNQSSNMEDSRAL